MKHHLVKALAVIVLFNAFAYGHEGHNDAFQSKEGNTAISFAPIVLSPDSQQAIGLKVAPVKTGSLSGLLKVTGEVQPADKGLFDITPSVNGIVKAVLVKQGDSVYAGQPLARLHSMEVATVVNQLLQSLIQIQQDRQHVVTPLVGDIRIQKNEVVLTQATFNREQTLLREGITARKDFIEAQSAYQTARVKLSTLQQRLNQEHYHYRDLKAVTVQTAKSQLKAMGLPTSTVDQAIQQHRVSADINIVSPANGIVASRDITLGQSVATGKRVFSIVKLSPIWVILDIYQEQIPAVQIGQLVDISTPNGIHTQGRIDSIGSIVDPAKRTLSVRVIVDNANGALKPQLFVNAAIQTRRSTTQHMLIPVNALVDENDLNWVYVKNGNQFSPVKVTVLSKDNQYAEIADGLFKGDLIVVQGLEQLKAQRLIASRAEAPDTHQHEEAPQKPDGFNNTLTGIIIGMLLTFAGVFLFNRIRRRKR